MGGLWVVAAGKTGGPQAAGGAQEPCRQLGAWAGSLAPGTACGAHQPQMQRCDRIRKPGGRAGGGGAARRVPRPPPPAGDATNANRALPAGWSGGCGLQRCVCIYRLQAVGRWAPTPGKAIQKASVRGVASRGQQGTKVAAKGLHAADRTAAKGRAGESGVRGGIRVAGPFWRGWVQSALFGRRARQAGRAFGRPFGIRSGQRCGVAWKRLVQRMPTGATAW